LRAKKHKIQEELPEPEEDRLIYIDVEIYYKVNDKELPDTAVDTEDIGVILEETIGHMGYKLNIPALVIIDINYITTH